MFVNAVSLTEITNIIKLIVGISNISSWNCSLKCHLMLDVFRSGTMQVEKRRFCTQYVQIKYFEASWPGARVAHRIEPLHGSMHAYTKKRNRRDDEHRSYDVRQRCQDYNLMLHNLMVMIQQYLQLTDDSEQHGARNSVDLVRNTEVYHMLRRQQREENRICIWLEDMW